MVGNQEGIGTLKLECPQAHPVGRILKDVPHQMTQYDPGVAVGPRRFWPGEDENQEFNTVCRHCDKPVGDATATLRSKFSDLAASVSETVDTFTLPYV
ncbi:MAG: hypothetical protein WBZ37_13950 [Mycobacterium sp.]